MGQGRIEGAPVRQLLPQGGETSNDRHGCEGNPRLPGWQAFLPGRSFRWRPLPLPRYRLSMSTEFGWWNKDDEGRKFQVIADVHGGNVTWTRKQGHHAPWETHPPTPDDWDRLIAEASRRVPRRLLSPKQFAVIERLREAAR